MMLIYNGIVINNTIIRDWQLNTDYTEDRVVAKGTRIRMTIEGIISDGITDYSGLTPMQAMARGGTADLTTDIIYQTLMTNRGILKYIIASKVVILSPENGSISDANNGPTPISLNITQITGVKSWHVIFTIETTLLRCPGSTVAQALIAHRFTQSINIDEVSMSIRTTKGIAHFRTDILNDNNLVVDYFRDDLFAMFPLTRGWKRLFVNVGTSSDNKTLAYQFIDKEMTYDIGDTNSPDSSIARHIKDIEADYSTENGYYDEGGKGVPAGIIFATNTIRVIGNKLANLWNMTQYAITLCTRKFDYTQFGPAPGITVIFRHIKVRQTYSTSSPKSVTVSIGAQITNPNQLAKNMLFQAFNFGLKIDDVYFGLNKNLGMNPAPPAGFGGRGSSPVILLNSALQNLCENPRNYYITTVNENNPPVWDSAPPIITVEPIEILETIPSPYNESDMDSKGRKGQDTDYRLEEALKKETGRVYMPSAGATDTYSGLLPSVAVQAKPEILTIFSPSSTRHVAWHAERIGAMPNLPIPEQVLADTGIPYASDYIYLNSIIKFINKQPLADGSIIFRVDGEYVYGSKNATGAGDIIILPAAPNLVYPYGDEIIMNGDPISGVGTPQSDYYTGIIDGGTRQPAKRKI